MLIWTKKVDNRVIYFTSDNKSHRKLNEALLHVSNNFDDLRRNKEEFNIMFNRKKKLDIIMSKI
jgi:hypothetical protein